MISVTIFFDLEQGGEVLQALNQLGFKRSTSLKYGGVVGSIPKENLENAKRIRGVEAIEPNSEEEIPF